MTGYRVYYNDVQFGGVLSPLSKTADITGLTGGTTYIITVEAISQHLFGESETDVGQFLFILVPLRIYMQDDILGCQI